MAQLLTSAEMRAIERAAIESGRVSGLELMERAGQGVVAAILRQWPQLAQGKRRALILCGPGNNGGDGFVVARLLHQRGWQAEVYLYGECDRLPDDAQENCRRWQALGPVHGACDEGAAAGADLRADLFLDALFGTGLTRPIEDTSLRQWLSARAGAAHRVAVDIPSGISADSGEVLGQAFRADLTVTFHALKRGHRLGEGPEYCGKVEVADIGL